MAAVNFEHRQCNNHPVPKCAEHIEADIKRHVGMTAKVRLPAAGSLRRTEGKTRHVIRGC